LFENHEFLATPDKTTFTKKVPIVILINRGSASASEILSGALKDYHLAYLVGEKTYGKGSVQQVIPLSNTDGFKMTTARYYTPSDVNIDKIGIPPDLEIKNFFIPKEQEDVYVKLVESGELEKLAKENSNMTEAEITKAAEELAKTYPIDLRILRRLIRVQAKKAQSAALYDMDYDIQLQEALKIVQRPDFFDLVKNTKTLKELQEEAEQKAAETQEEE
jgi:carboxyl-terminal processing protease